MSEPKIYLAGPDIFRTDAFEFAEEQKELCRKAGFEPLHPFDNNIEVKKMGPEYRADIYAADIKQMIECDAIIANLNSFRGVEPDGGTAFEIGWFAGFNAALSVLKHSMPNKRIYSYVDDPAEYKMRAKRAGFISELDQEVDKDGMMISIFDSHVNLMLQVSSEEEGAFITDGFEKCLDKMVQDKEAGLFLQNAKAA